MRAKNHQFHVICFLTLAIAAAASRETATAQTANPSSSTKTNGVWPTGTSGNLVVASGQVVTIPAGSVLDLASLTVQSGGTLQIERGSGWTIIGCTGDITLRGTIAGVTCDKPYGLITATAPDGNVLRHYYTINSGGGTHGFNGQALYIKTLGTFRGLGGKINLSGGPGGNGGNGGNAPDTTPNGQSGGGGGGDSGGAGGRLILLYSGEYLPPEIHVEGGTTGKGGVGGAGSTQPGGTPPANSGVPGDNGTAGGSGAAGRITIFHGTTLPNISAPANPHLVNPVPP